MADITDLLNRWSAGDRQAFEEMAPLVYSDLKRVPRRSLQHEQHAATLNCTALVHEAYLRLVNQDRMEWSGRKHFFGAAAGVMRQVLVELARQRLSEKRGAGATHEPLDRVIAAALEPDLDVMALDEALDELAKADPEIRLRGCGRSRGRGSIGGFVRGRLKLDFTRRREARKGKDHLEKLCVVV